jgi:hypothetical protein
VLPPSSDEPKSPLSLPDIVLPVGIDLGEARVDRLRLFNAGEASPFLEIDHAALSASLRDGTLAVTRDGGGLAGTEARGARRRASRAKG